ncbi:MAG: hypothetical protein QNK31_10885, partial [Porticoccus sp.]|nr:hypothetical protein [Porticoccus sp.]
SVCLSACGGGGGGGGGSTSCDNALTVSYIQKNITEFPGFTESNTTIVHTDGAQGNTYDIDLVAVSRTTYNMNDSLAFSYTVFGTATPPAGTYGAFFLDTDQSAITGATIGTMGADALVVSAPGGSANGFYLWGGSSWVKQSVLGVLSSNASYFQGCTHSTTVYAPMYSGLSSLYATPVTGIVMVLTIPGSDPTDVTSILDSSSQFDFTVP